MSGAAAGWTRRWTRRLGLAAFLAPLALGSACASTERGTREPVGPPVRLDALTPGVLVAPAPGPGEVAQAVARLHTLGAQGSALRLARRDPARLLAALVHGSAQPADLSRAAAVYERATGAASADGGWSAHFAQRAASPATFRDFDEARAALLSDLRAGDIGSAAERLPLPVPRGTPGASVLTLQALALEGQVRLAAGEIDAAAESFAAAARTAGAERPFEQARCLLLQWQAVQRLDPPPESAGWSEAVAASAALRGLSDPDFWLAAAASRPAGSPWPAEALTRAESAVAPDGDVAPADAEALVTGWIGLQLLAAERAEEALLWLMQAESLASSARARQALGVQQARALVALGRAPEATARLSTLAESSDAVVSRSALALLGALDLKLLRPERALPLLTRALDGASEATSAGETRWSGRAEAQADLGIALLLLGRDDEGLIQLREAQARFELEQDWDGLARALRNELAWTTEARRHADAELLRARLAEAELR